MTKKKPDFLRDLDTAIMDELTGGGIKGNAAGLVGTLTQIKEIKQLCGLPFCGYMVRVSAAAGLLYRRLLRLAASSAADRAVFITFRRAYKRTGNSNHALGATQEREAKNENNKHFELKGRRSQDLYSGKHGV